MPESEPSAPPEVVDDDVLRERLFHVIYHHDYQDGASGTTRGCRSLAASLAQFLVGQRTDLAAAIERAERAERGRDEFKGLAATAADWLQSTRRDLDQARAQLAKVREALTDLHFHSRIGALSKLSAALDPVGATDVVRSQAEETHRTPPASPAAAEPEREATPCNCPLPAHHETCGHCAGVVGEAGWLLLARFDQARNRAAIVADRSAFGTSHTVVMRSSKDATHEGGA